jgi:putative integral membrane protein (TIGR02587 family)
MAPSQADSSAQHATNGQFWIGLARAFAGALIFSISLLMTMEMWWLGFYMSRGRLALFTVVMVVLLVGLARYSGFRKDTSWRDSVVDAFVGYAVGVASALAFLPLLGVLEPGMSADEIVGKVALQAIAGSIGALLARSQLGGGEDKDKADEDELQHHYWTELFLMVVGALFVAFTVAPTDEMVLISYMMTPWHAIAAVVISLIIIHTFVYEVEFHGQHAAPAGMGFWTLFLRFSVVGYALVLLTSLYILWTFGRTDATAFGPRLMATVVLALPGSLGAAAARLIL